MLLSGIMGSQQLRDTDGVAPIDKTPLPGEGCLWQSIALVDYA